MCNLFIKAIEGAENKLEGLKTWAKKEEKRTKSYERLANNGLYKTIGFAVSERLCF